MQKSFARVDPALAMPPLRTESSLTAVCCQAFELTLNESRIFVALLKQDHATKAELHAALFPNGDPVTNIQGVGVTIHTLRKKLARFGIDVINIYGLGYRLAEGARDRTRKLLADYGQDIMDAVTPLADQAAPRGQNLKPKGNQPDLFNPTFGHRGSVAKNIWPSIGDAGPKLKEQSFGSTPPFSKTAENFKPQGGFITPVFAAAAGDLRAAQSN